MRSIILLLILVMIGLNGKGQSVTALPDSVLSQCCLEVTLLNGNVTTVDWVFIQYITRDGTGTKLFVEYAPNFGGIQWETQIRIQDDFDGVLERSKFIMLPFTVGSTDYAINRNWIANIEENTTTGGTWIYGRFGTPAKRKFSAVEDYETLKSLLLACRPRAIIVAENGLYTEGDTVRMGGFLIENTSITTEGYNWQMKDTASSAEFGLDYNTPFTGDTTVYWARRFGKVRQMAQMGRNYWKNEMIDTTTNMYSEVLHSWSSGDPFWKHSVFDIANLKFASITSSLSSITMLVTDDILNPVYTPSVFVNYQQASLGVNESGGLYPGNGVQMGAIGYGAGNELLFMKTKNVDDGTATVGQFLQLKDLISGEVEFATVDLSSYLPIADTAAMLSNYVTFGNLSGYPTGSGTADRLARWTSTNTLAAGNLSDNGTRLQALLPWQFHSWTTAGRPTGVTGYTGYNTTDNGPEWYQGSRWAKVLESTFSRGTATYVPIFDANGQITESQYFRYLTSTNTLNIGNSDIKINASNIGALTSVLIGGGTVGTQSVNIRGISAGNGGTAIGISTTAGQLAIALGVSVTAGASSFALGSDVNVSGNAAVGIGNAIRVSHAGSVAIGRATTTTATGQFVVGSGGNNSSTITDVFFGSGVQRGNPYDATPANGANYTIHGSGALGTNFAGGNITIAGGKGTGSGTAGDVIFSTSTLLGSGSTLQALSPRWYVKGGTGRLGNVSSPQRDLHVAGEARITDLTTDTPTRIVGADADGDLGEITFGTGLSLVGNVLSATGTSDGNGIYSGSATLTQHTTRARIPNDGNLLFSQVYNGGADSTYWQVVNYGSGERALNFGLTDTASTGYARASFYSDGTGVMNWGFETSDAVFGNTTVRAFEGDLSLSVNTGVISLSTPVDSEVRITGIVRAKQEGYYEINSTSSPQNLSNTYSDNFINQGGTQATFTLVFPASPEDGQVLTLTYNNAISSLTLDGNGNTIVGTTVTTAVAGSQRKFKFYAGAGVWIRIY